MTELEDAKGKCDDGSSEEEEDLSGNLNNLTGNQLCANVIDSVKYERVNL